MLKTVLVALALTAAAQALAQAPAVQAPAADHAKPLSVDSLLSDLILDPRTRPVIDRHLPGFATRMIAEPEVAQMFGGISLADLQHDPHVKGMTPEVLAKIDAEIAEAQKPSAS